MRKLSLIVLVPFLFAGLASGQIPTRGNVFFGYSYYNADVTSLGRTSFNGWNASVEGRVGPFVGIVADISSIHGSADKRTTRTRSTCANNQGGVQQEKYIVVTQCAA